MTTLGLLLAVSAEALSLAFGHLSNGLNYYRSGKQDMALREFGIVLSEYRDTPAADDALYWSAMAEQARGGKDQADATLAELARLYPNSPYVGASGAPATAPSIVKPAMPAAPTAVAEPPKIAPAPAAAPTTIPPVRVIVKRSADGTVIELNGVPFKNSPDFELALTDLKRSRSNLTVLFRRDSDVDLQMVIDVINAFEKLQITYRTQ